MATNLNQKSSEIKDFSGAVQRDTSKFSANPNQVELAINADFSRTGAVGKIAGFDQLGNTITSSTTTSSTTTTSTSTSTSTSSSTSSSTSTSSTTTP